jgi:hypothetical protein
MKNFLTGKNQGLIPLRCFAEVRSDEGREIDVWNRFGGVRGMVQKAHAASV